ncbi:ABC transporter permease [Pseudohoeflea coraliihabitans]|uniref:ABC transporter permease n=1 Tax=Pseudohoeflea coraliihabitans TaxID=2860393 RepID=A0ABS6WNL6_9HYPH|nr:ABC transporter permease [Pseudohoeflea sp. DP4N28-3]MBW3097541.1 ABC transporter permease [Pseudohoeflea sp. DP4N28-3]
MARQSASKPRAALAIDDLHVFYGEAHVVQGVSLKLEQGVMSVVGRNGMGKSTLCNTITGLKEARSGSIRLHGREISRLEPHQIHHAGIAYVPQGRRVWPSLSVDEHLRLAAEGGADAAWTLDRIYQTFPRLFERRTNGGSQLSGGEQQMLAISRALLANPKLLVMDEPTEGLAPVIVDQVAEMLIELGQEGEMAILVIEQNIGVATSVSDTVAIMVNGQINRTMEAGLLAADRELQQRLLGVGRHGEEDDQDDATPTLPDETVRERLAEVYVVSRQGAGSGTAEAGGLQTMSALPNRWNLPAASLRDERVRSHDAGKTAARRADEAVFAIPFAERIGRTIYVAGTFDTKSRELGYVRDCLKDVGMAVKTVDLSTTRAPSRCDVTPLQVAGHHPGGPAAVFGEDRGQSVTAMAEAFARFMARERGVGGIISAGGSGGTTLATAGMRALPVGIPKVMVSTVAAGDTRPYVGAADINMFYSVTDVQGLNLISERVLANAAHAMAGMVARLPDGREMAARQARARPALGLTMFGVTTPCVQAVQKTLQDDYDCLVFHATGTGGRAMENLARSGLLAGIIDITTTEVADMLVGGVFPADEDRFGAVIDTGLPWVGSCGALDMVNFGPRASVPEKFNSRKFVIHNPSVTLMRTTAEENRRFGEWIGERINRMEGPVRFLIPEGGVSVLDRPDAPFHDPAANAALFEALEATVRQTARRQIIRVKANLNDPAFSQALVAAYQSIASPVRRSA